MAQVKWHSIKTVTAWIKCRNVLVPCAWVIFLPRAGGIQKAPMIATDKLPLCFGWDDSFMDTALGKAELPCDLLIMIKILSTTSILLDLPHVLHTYLCTCQLYIPVPTAQDPAAAGPRALSLSQWHCSTAGPQSYFWLVVRISCLRLGLIPFSRLMLPGMPVGPITVPLARALPVHVAATDPGEQPCSCCSLTQFMCQICYTGLDIPSLSTPKATQDQVALLVKSRFFWMLRPAYLTGLGWNSLASRKHKVCGLHLRLPESQLLNKPKALTMPCLKPAVHIILCMHRLEGHISPMFSSPSCGFCSMGHHAAEGPTPSCTTRGTGTGGASTKAQPPFPTAIWIRLGLYWVQAPLPASLDASSR